MKIVTLSLLVLASLGCIDHATTTGDGDVGPQECRLPGIGDPCHIPRGDQEAREIILAEAPCLAYEVRPGEFRCSFRPIAIGGYDLPNWFDRPLPDYSIYRCSSSRVTHVWRAVINDMAQVIHVPQEDCGVSACRFFSPDICVHGS